MRRLVMATVVLTALAGVAQAGGPPKAIRLVNRMKMYDSTHYIRGSHGKSSGGSMSSTVEARQEPKAPEPAKPGQKQTPPPQKAD
jgi:hypothetical protein